MNMEFNYDRLKDPGFFAENRAPAHSDHIAYASLDELEAYMADYRENARWLTSEESIARYRRFAGALVPVAPDIDFESPLGALMVSYLDGNLTPAQFIDRLPGTME